MVFSHKELPLVLSDRKGDAPIRIVMILIKSSTRLKEAEEL